MQIWCLIHLNHIIVVYKYLIKNTLLSEGKTLDFVIIEKTVSEAITEIVNAITDYGFIVGTVSIENDSTIGAYSTLDKTAFDVFQYLKFLILAGELEWLMKIQLLIFYNH